MLVTHNAAAACQERLAAAAEAVAAESGAATALLAARLEAAEALAAAREHAVCAATRCASICPQRGDCVSAAAE